MPNTTSAKKALRQNTRRRTRNLTKNRAYKDAIKAYRKLVAAGKTSEAAAQLAKVAQALDKAAKAKTIKKNKASRLKSRLAHALAKKG